MTFRPTRGAAWAVLLCLAASTAAAIDVPLIYVRHPEKHEEYLPYGLTEIEVSITPPQGQWTLPQGLGKMPIYGLLDLGDTKRLMIFSRRNSGDAFYNRLFFDQDGNGDLTDDAPVEGKYETEGYQRYSAHFPAIDTRITVDGSEQPYRLQPLLIVWDLESLKQASQQPDRIPNLLYGRCHVRCHYAGTLELGGEKFYLTLSDRNGDGRFGERLSMTESDAAYGPRPLRMYGDHLYLTRNPALHHRDRFICTDYFRLKGQTYELGIDIAGRRLTLTPTSRTLATLKLAQKPHRLTLHAPHEGGEDRSAAFFEPGAEVQIPVDEYRLASYEILRKTACQEWLVKATATDATRKVIVAPGPEATLTFGEPYVPRAEIPEHSLRQTGRPARLEFWVEGAGKEQVTDLKCLNGRYDAKIPMSVDDKDRPEEPKYKILTAEGELVTQGVFEYG